jgi:D-aspartate ligase
MEANGLGVARALARHHIPVIGLAGPSWTPSCATKTCTEIVYNRSWTQAGVVEDLRSIARRLDHKSPLIITKDEPVLWISEARSELDDSFELNLPDHDVVQLLMNKTRFHEVCVAKGWPVPRTWKAKSKDELASALSEIEYPCILKPQVKNRAFRRFSAHKAFVVRDERQLLRAYETVAQWEPEVVVQEWIPGGDGSIAFCLSYHDRQGMPAAQFAGRKLRQWPIRCGNTAIAEPAPAEWVDRLLTVTQTIWDDVGFRGIGSIEYKIAPGTQRPVIMEPTVGRTNYQNEVAVLNGVNIPAIAYCDLTGGRYVATAPPARPVKLIDGGAELKAAVTYWRMGELGVAQWLTERSGNRKYMMVRAGDLGPFLASMGVKIKRSVRRLLKLVLVYPVVAACGRHLRRRGSTHEGQWGMP